MRRVSIALLCALALYGGGVLALSESEPEALAAGDGEPDEAVEAEADVPAAAEDAEEEEEVAPGLPEPEEGNSATAAGAAGDSSVQFVVTQKMRSQLAALGYTESEIGALNAERAAAIVRDDLRTSNASSALPSAP